MGRVLQGASAAVVWVVGLALLVDTVGPDEIGQAMGYVGLSMSLALLVAPLLGGVVFANAGYYAVFAMAFGLMALDVFLRVVLIEKKVAVKWTTPEFREQQKKGVTVERNRDSVASIEMDAVGASAGPTRRATRHLADQHIVGPDLERITSTRSAADEVLPEDAPPVIKRWSQKLPPVIFLLSSRRLLSALWACIIQASLYTAFDSILPLFVRDTFRWNSTGAGLIFLPIVIVSFFGPFVGWLTDKYGARLFAIAGYVLGCPSIILLRLVHKDTMGQKVLLCALLALVGLSLALVVTPMMAEITYAVEAKARSRAPGHFGKNGAYAQAYSLFNVAWAAGCMIGPLLAGLVNQANGWGTATLILGCISIFTAIPVAIWTGGSIFKKKKARREERTRQENDTMG
jgi:MFS family permease